MRQKIELADDITKEPYISLIKKLAVDDKLDFDTAKLLMSAIYEQLMTEKSRRSFDLRHKTIE